MSKPTDGAANDAPMNLAEMRRSAKRASRLLKALSNEHRLLVLCELSQGEKSVSELERRIGLSQSALSQHLARLRRDTLVQTRRQAQTIYYSLAGIEATKVIDTLYGLYCADSCAQEQPAAATALAAALG